MRSQIETVEGLMWRYQCDREGCTSAHDEQTNARQGALAAPEAWGRIDLMIPVRRGVRKDGQPEDLLPAPMARGAILCASCWAGLGGALAAVLGENLARAMMREPPKP